MLLEKHIEKIILALLCIMFFIGLWHGFPFTNIVADEMFFSGSVLRSMDAYTFLPLSLDVPYGTITFYISYFVIGIGLSLTYLFTGFSISNLKFFIIKYPYFVYALSRLVSFATAIFLIFNINNFLKKYVEDYRTRLYLLVVLFTNILVNLILHTSKVWVVSTFFMLVSFYFLTQAFENVEFKQNKKNIFLSIIFAFLSFSNFPFMGMSLINILIFIYVYRKDRKSLFQIIKYSSLGLLIFVLILLTNFSGIKAQIYSIIYDYTLSPGSQARNLTLFSSIISHLLKIFKMFPIILGTWATFYFVGKVKNRSLYNVSLLYLFTYVILLILVDRWSVESQSSLRYLFPVPFFLIAILASYDFSFKKFLYIPAILSIVYIVPTLYYLSIGTTSHELVSFVRNYFSESSNVVIINNVGVDAPLPQNKQSYLLAKSVECGSLCKATIQYDLEKVFKPLVFDSHTNQEKIKNIIKNSDVYYLERNATTSLKLTLVKSFINPVKDNAYYTLDSSGNYFDLTYFKLRKFGPNLYLYKMIGE